MKWQRKISNGCWSPNRISKSFGKGEFWFHWISKKKNKTLGKYLCRKLRYRHIPFLKLKGPWLKNWTKMNKCIEGGHRNGYLAWFKVRGCSLQYIDYSTLSCIAHIKCSKLLKIREIFLMEIPSFLV